MRRVSIVEVSPRDGLQGESTLLSTDVKVELIRRAIGCGIKRLEVTSFVHPKRVPAMADAEEVVRRLPRRDDVSYIGLVLNRKGLLRALDAGVDEIGMVVIATDSYNLRNQGVTTHESAAEWLQIAKEAKAAGIRTSVTISAAFGCPYEGEVDASKVLEIADRVLAAEPDELAVADTIGAAVPAQVRDLIGALQEKVPGRGLRIHLHNTRNMGLANAQAAIDAGIAAIDASIGGIGGCPFAPAATGNIPTEDLLYLLDRSGVESGVSLEKAIETSNWLRDVLGHEVPALLPKAGIFPKVADEAPAARG